MSTLSSRFCFRTHALQAIAEALTPAGRSAVFPARRMQRYGVKTVLLLVASTALCSCGASPGAQGSAPGAPARINLPATDAKENQSVAEHVFKLETQVSSLLATASKTAAEVSVLRTRLEGLTSGSATVSTERDEYGIARTPFGPFTVISRAVTPYLDGFRITLAIGNLTAATFQGAKLKVSWGPPFDSTNFVKDRKERGFDVTTIFSPGAYAIVVVALTPASANEIKEIDVGITLNQMSLR